LPVAASAEPAVSAIAAAPAAKNMVFISVSLTTPFQRRFPENPQQRRFVAPG
jgi:hypothetical protein